MTDQADLFESTTREIPLSEALGERYLAYALSTITARSLPRRARRAEAGTPAPPVRDAPVAARPRRRVQEMRPRGRRRHGQVPSARRPGDLRRDGADGPGLRRALPAGRGAGEFPAISTATARRRCATPRRGSRATRWLCSTGSTRTRSIFGPTTTAPTTNRRCCRRASPTCSATGRAESPSAWRPAFRRTIWARSATRRST